MWFLDEQSINLLPGLFFPEEAPSIIPGTSIPETTSSIITTSADSIVLNHSYGFSSANPCSYSQLNNSSNAVLWLRGGGKYFVFTDWDASWSVKTASTTISDQTVAPVTSCPSISLTKSTIISLNTGDISLNCSKFALLILPKT